MKKLLLLFSLISLGLNAQIKTDSIQDFKIQNLNDNIKRTKPLFFASGLTLIAGSVVNYISATAKTPSVTSANYQNEMGAYLDKQSQLKKTSLFMYGLSGVFLIAITIEI